MFGSNFAFFIRRLEAARNYIAESKSAKQPLQYIGATATIAKPNEHMKLLTGHEFAVIDDNADGSPQHDRILAHVACQEGEELEIAKSIQNYILTTDSDKAFITFVDSRKAVEILALSARGEDDLTGPTVSPYRSGFITEDRRRIERQLREGSLRGVVSTAALELGIDLPRLSAGLNIGVPWSRKSYRQRIGRVGRNGPGAFVIIGTPDAFAKFGTSFREYHDLPVEPSYLYLDNRFMQFAHARCLVDEREALAAPATLPTPAQWPDRFEEAYVAARPGGIRPIEFDAIARLAGDTPHRGYPLRNVGEFNYDIKVHENAPSLGDTSEVYALRECYPGATYLHNMNTYEVVAWRYGHSPYIQVRHAPSRGLTKPQLTTWINADVTANSFLKGPRGFLAECQMEVTEQVKGYIDAGGTFHSYADLRQSNPNMKSRNRRFRTSGVVLHMDNEWFKQEANRRIIADKIREIFVHEYSINPQDIGSAVTHISLHGLDEKAPRSGCIAIYDETYGSLRLTEKLYSNFGHIIQPRMANAIAKEFSPIVAEIHDAFSDFASHSPSVNRTEDQARTGYVPALKPKSQALFGEPGGGVMQEVEILQLTILPDGRLMYQVEASTRPGQPPLRRWIPFDSTVPSPDSDAYEIGWWNQETQEFEDSPDEES